MVSRRPLLRAKASAAVGLARRMLASGVLSEESLPSPRVWLRELDYEDSLIQQDWSLRHMDTGETDLMIPYMAFWNQPFDIFHTALAVVHQNGVPAQDIAVRTASNVLLYTGNDVELWLLNERNGITAGPRVPAKQVRSLITQFKDRLRSTKVAKEKIRWRQYALYEADPNGNNAFREWSIQPDTHQTDRTLKKLIRDVVPAPTDDVSAPADRVGLLRDRARWLFRLLSLRVGRDRGWGIVSHLASGAVTEFAKQATLYPGQWQSDTSHMTGDERTKMSEQVLSRLEHYDFSTTDPIFITRAVGAARLRKVRLETDLFPTPKPFAWDMMASVPLSEGMCICDATAGTGTFLIAAGHAVWDQANIGSGELPDLREILRGGDQSRLSADLTQIGLDLAFGWRSAGWNVGVATAKDTLAELPQDRPWALVGNLPWSAKGKSRNASAIVVEQYVNALSHRDTGWIAVIVPRSAWTSVKQEDVCLRERIADALQVESAWELPWGAIPGGRAQAIAAVLSKGRSATTSIWKQVDERGTVHTVGYSRPSRSLDDCVSAPARYLRKRLSGSSLLGDHFDVWEGVKFKGIQSGNPLSGGTVPVMRRKKDVGAPVREPLELTVEDIKEKGGWIHQNSNRRAKSYAEGLLQLPQLAFPRHIYEGTRSGMQSLLIKQPMLLSDAFLIAVPRDGFTAEFVRGVGALLNTALGRLWLHVFATFGRDLSNRQAMNFPLPPSDQVEMWGRKTAERVSRHFLGDSQYEMLRPTRPSADAGEECATFTLDEELDACRAYGLEDHEGAAVLGLSKLAGMTDSIPRNWLDDLDDTLPNKARIDSLLQKARTLSPDDPYLSDLNLQLLSERRKQERLVAGGGACELSIRKSSVTGEADRASDGETGG